MQEINLEQLDTLTKSIISALSSRPNPKIEREENLLVEIANITDIETALKAKDLFHSYKNVYIFDDYLHCLSRLVDLLLCGTPPDEAFDNIRDSIIEMYQEPPALLKDYF